MGDIVKFRPGVVETLDDLFAEAKAHGVTKVIIVGITDDNEPYVESTNHCLLSELAWMALLVHNTVANWMKK